MVNDITFIAVFLGIFLLCSITEFKGSGIKTILVPTDFSESSNVALRTAIDLAGQQKARIYLLHVVPLGHGVYEEELMRKQLAGFPEAKSVEIIPDIRKGRPHEEILKVQTEEHIDLIVIARHGNTGFLYNRYRSVTEKVKKGAQCSVLVIGA
jgi:nucleotide-binding universal stress UspA family protein